MIRRSPAITLPALLKSACGQEPPPGGSDRRTIFTGYARYALRNIFHALGLKPGTRILVPSYVCSVVLLPFAELQLVPEYYRVDDNFCIDLDSIPGGDDVRGILTVNYFGLSQDMSTLADLVAAKGWIWINDNAHGYASLHDGQELDRFGDFSITSFRKSLPVLNGAYATINAPRYFPLAGEMQAMSKPLAQEGRFRYIAKALASACGWKSGSLPEYSETAVRYDDDPKRIQADAWGVHLACTVAPAMVRERRADNYRQLAAFFADRNYPGIAPLRPLLRQGNAPLVFPLEATEHRTWSSFLQRGRRANIDMHLWPTLPEEVLKKNLHDCAKRAQRYLFLPVHQDLRMQGYLDTLERAFSAQG